VNSWVPEGEIPNWLEAKDWFLLGHHAKLTVWSLPPAVADIGLEQLAKAILKGPYNDHIILVPCLMAGHRWKCLGKICYLIFSVPLGCSFWPSTQLKPLVVGVSFCLT
jgi:hypothetical protein